MIRTIDRTKKRRSNHGNNRNTRYTTGDRRHHAPYRFPALSRDTQYAIRRVKGLPPSPNLRRTSRPTRRRNLIACKAMRDVSCFTHNTRTLGARGGSRFECLCMETWLSGYQRLTHDRTSARVRSGVPLTERAKSKEGSYENILSRWCRQDLQ